MQIANLAASRRNGILLQYNYKRKCLWKCKYGHTFWLTVYKVNRRGKWCPECGDSKGERIIRDILYKYGINFQQQYTISTIPKYKYDFYFEWKNKKYLIEYDGIQHFKYVRKYHTKKSGLRRRKIIDCVKTYVAVETGYNIIRIDYTQEGNIENHIINAINLQWLIYYSTQRMYQYIINKNLQLNELIEYAPNFISNI